MNLSPLYITISIASLAILALLFVVLTKRRKSKNLTSLTGLAFGFILAGIMFGESRFLGYSLLSIGLTLSVVDILKLARSNRKFRRGF